MAHHEAKWHVGFYFKGQLHALTCWLKQMHII